MTLKHDPILLCSCPKRLRVHVARARLINRAICLCYYSDTLNFNAGYVRTLLRYRGGDKRVFTVSTCVTAFRSLPCCQLPHRERWCFHPTAKKLTQSNSTYTRRLFFSLFLISRLFPLLWLFARVNTIAMAT
jgi:hypothetical protein